MNKNREGSRHILEGLKDVMLRCGLPVTEIAERANLTRQYLHLILTDRANPTLETIEKIFDACGDSFGEWFRTNAAERYGRDKSTHDRLQAVLDAKGEYQRMARTSIDAWLALRRAESATEPDSKDALHQKTQS